MPNTTLNRFKKYRKGQLDLIKDTPTRNALEGLQGRITEIEKQLQQYTYGMSAPFNGRQGLVLESAVEIRSDGSPVMLMWVPKTEFLTGEISWRSTDPSADTDVRINIVFYRNGQGFDGRRWGTIVKGVQAEIGVPGSFFTVLDLTPVVGGNTYQVGLTYSGPIGMMVSGRLLAVPLPFLRRPT